MNSAPQPEEHMIPDGEDAFQMVSPSPRPRPARERPRAPDELDLNVGKRVREQRVGLGMSQKSLADAIGVSFQQIQNYESGLSRIAAGRLYDISRAMGVSIAFFFFEMATPEHSINGTLRADRGDLTGTARERRDLIRAFSRISRQETRSQILEFLRGIHPAH